MTPVKKSSSNVEKLLRPSILKESVKSRKQGSYKKTTMRTPYVPNTDAYIQHYGGLPTFRGDLFQDGHGLGSLFGSLARKVVPLFSKYVAPTLKTAGKTLLKSSAEAISDVISGERDFKTAFRERGKEGLKNVGKQVVNRLNQSGEGRRRRNKRLKLSHRPDIFDKTQCH